MGCCVSGGKAPRTATAYQTDVNGGVKRLLKEINDGAMFVFFFVHFVITAYVPLYV